MKTSYSKKSLVWAIIIISIFRKEASCTNQLRSGGFLLLLPQKSVYTHRMNTTDLSKYLAPVIKACALWKDKILHVVVIANPAAGGFTRKNIATMHGDRCKQH